jgi:hypothetical protein
LYGRRIERRLAELLIPYPGRRPSNVNRDAKYSVISSPGGGYEVRLIYRVSVRERELLTTDRHDELVRMVNSVKLEATGLAGGAFYINEYFDVLVPTVGKGFFYAGSYERLLEFDYDGGVIGPRPPQGLNPGGEWRGPHAGVSYTLTADCRDFKFETETRPRHIQEYRLSDYCDASEARDLASRLCRVKGAGGGRIYINEVGEFFAPLMDSAQGLRYVYLGPLGEDCWFPAPDVDRGGR